MLASFLLAATLHLFPDSASAQLAIHFFDVGQGDAAIIKAPHRVVLVDAGPSPDKVVTWLQAAGVGAIDLAIASHNHADHIGGMAGVLASVPVRNYMENGMPAATQTYARTVAVLEQRGIPVLRATSRRIDLGDGVAIRILAPAPFANSQNDASIGIEVIYGRFRALFTGDAETPQREFWATDMRAPIQVLKVSHHGSINGTDSQLLRATMPCVAVISVGGNNSFGHPAPEVITQLSAAKVAVFRTDEAGHVTITADSTGSYKVLTEKGSVRAGTFKTPCR